MKRRTTHDQTQDRDQKLGTQQVDQLPGRLWELGAEAWTEVLPPDSWPLKWLRDGVMMWPKGRKGLRRRGLPNKFRDKKEEQWALRQLLRLADKYGVVEECSPEDVDHISGIRCIPKELDGPDDKWYRLVVRMCKLNERFGTRRFKVGNFLDEIGQDVTGWFGATVDISKAYFHLKLADQAKRWCGVEVAGRTFRYRAIPFGWSLSPWIFCTFTKHIVQRWRKMTRFRGAIVVVFYDDFMVLAPTKAQAEELLEFMRQDLRRFGFWINDDKSSGVSQTVLFVGHELRLQDGRVGLKPGRARKYAVLAARAAGKWAARKGRTTQAWTSRKFLEQLLGKLNHAAGLHWSLRPFLRAMFQDLNRGGRKKINLSWESIHDLRAVGEQLENLDLRGAPLWRPALGAAVDIFSDASGLVGGGYGAHCDELDKQMGGRWEEAEWDRGATVAQKELRACRKALEVWAAELAGRRVRFYIDSQTVTYIWKRGGAKKKNRQAYARDLKAMVRVARAHDIELDNALWVPREENELADRLSKLHVGRPSWVVAKTPWDEAYRTEDWATPQGLVGTAERRLGNITVDAFASARTAKAETFYGPAHAVGAAEGSVFDAANVWSDPDQVVWAAPPLRLVAAAVRVATEGDAAVALVVPEWTARGWWQRLANSEEWERADTIAGNVVGDWEESELAGKEWKLALWIKRRRG